MISDHPFLCGLLAALTVAAWSTTGLVCLVCSTAGIAAAALLLIADRRLYS
jgi:hypothetical protein